LAFEDVVDALLLDNDRLNWFGRNKNPGSLKSIEFHEPNGENEQRSETERNHNGAPAPGIAKSVKASQTLGAPEWINAQDVKQWVNCVRPGWAQPGRAAPRTTMNCA
jgi:hypothetical protein